MVLSVTRIYTPQPLSITAPVVLDGNAARHLIQVLRLTTDDAVVLFNGDGYEYSGHIVTAARHAVTITLIHRSELEPPSPLNIALGLGITKSERMDYSLQKSVELGASAFVPLFTARSVIKLDAQRLKKRQQHWWGIIIAACEQSGRRRIPTLATAVPLATWLTEQYEMSLLLDPRTTLGCDALTPPPSGCIRILIGPEGGLTPAERMSAHEAGFQSIRLGPRILRTETAPLAALAALQILWGDLRNGY
nr:16S rRNA (uracil(1498)-N(3))-methyltransferase [Thiospirillum jenense]